VVRDTPVPARALIIGAAGRDFHNFNMVFRDDPAWTVVAFTAAQIPDIADRRYPAALAGPRYPSGIPIYPESELVTLIARERVGWVFLCYSDLSHLDVMHRASAVLAAGANFSLLGPTATMIRSTLPVISVCAVRTGTGKSALSRYIVRRLRGRGRRVVAIRHPMPYGDLEKQALQRFATQSDLDDMQVTIEEREEYEPYLEIGAVVYAGVDYKRIVAAAEQEADVIVWDGGNNDFPFVRPDLSFVLADPLRAGDEISYYPGETNVRMADVLVLSKVGSASQSQLDEVLGNLRSLRPDRPIVLADLEVRVDRPELIAGQRVVVVGDGPTLTHGGMAAGAGTIAAHQSGASSIVDARPYAVGSLAHAYHAFPHLQSEVPALGYSAAQVADLAETLRRVPADAVVDATPVNLARLMALDKPIVDVSYEFSPRGREIDEILDKFAALA